jgi:hypothetical protein
MTLPSSTAANYPEHALIVALDRPPDVLAVRSIESPNETFVRELLTAESETDPQLRLTQIKNAILSGQEFLSGYGHYAAGRLRRIPRQEAVSLETSVSLSSTASERARLAAAQTLELELWEADNADDLLNAHILSAFCNALGSAPEDLQNYLAEALNRLIFSHASPSDSKAKDGQRALRQSVAIQSEMKTLFRALEDWGKRRNSRDEALRLKEWLQQ